ncbi:MAG: tetratricopeptide repeat protein [Tannerella sp.]|jgi:tetratricopeptide (TPR) repeat protein|nr:tetratricopeptide repeat protein [Tannerella sp.]
MATKEKGAAQVKETVDFVSRSERFIEKHQMKILYGVGVVIVLAAAVLCVRYLYLAPREVKAANAIYKGEQYFDRDSFSLALHGNGADYAGFESIISDYGSTRSGNLAKAYAGICYFRLGQPDKALPLLKAYSGDDKMVAPAVTGLIGDCYVNLGQVKQGITYFEKAAKEADNEVISPTYLKKAGIAYEDLKQYAEAVKAYQAIKQRYANSQEAADIDKYITRASELEKQK